MIYADFITLGQFFAAPYSLKTDLKGLFKELQKFVYDEKLEKEQNKESANIEKTGHKKINLLTSETLKKLSDEYEAKNNWDRYFSDKLSVNSGKEFSKNGVRYIIIEMLLHMEKSYIGQIIIMPLSWQRCLKNV